MKLYSSKRPQNLINRVKKVRNFKLMSINVKFSYLKRFNFKEKKLRIKKLKWLIKDEKIRIKKFKWLTKKINMD